LKKGSYHLQISFRGSFSGGAVRPERKRPAGPKWSVKPYPQKEKNIINAKADVMEKEAELNLGEKRVHHRAGPFRGQRGSTKGGPRTALRKKKAE